MVDGQKPQTLLETLNVTNQDLYPNTNIYAIFTVLITMPVSSVSSERSFSAMRRIKNCLGATMGDERLSNLSLLHIHRTRNLSLEDVINKFAVRKNRRLDFTLNLLGALSGHQTPRCKLCLHFILYLATSLDGNGNDDFIAVVYVFSVFCNHAGVLHCHFHFLSLTYLP